MSRSFLPSALRVPAAIAACGCAGLLIAACSSSSSSGVAEPEHKAIAGPDYGAVAPAPAAAPAMPGQTSTAGLVKLAPAQSIIYTASLTIRVKNVTTTADKASGDVTSAGGYVASEQQTIAHGKHGVSQVSLQLKIPVSVYQPTLTELTALGKTLAFSTQAQDVTQQVADVSSRVASAEAAIRQLRALLSRAGTVSGLLSVQNQINSQQSSLEALLAQQEALDHETSYGTVTLQVNGPKAAPVQKKKPKAHHGLAAGLGTGWRALKASVVWLLTLLGTVLPFGVVLVVIGGVIYLGRRRMIRRRRPAQPAGTA
ncbi:MAG TPA: DUF4349 domain-containing protein [Streptosporangiaceae bacterium]|nr:DUF4349 domain-containing protein [Streptosporangiaceae bacterium]